MIVANLNKSYPSLIRAAETRPLALQGITTGDWPYLKEATLNGYDDLLVGTYDDMIVTAYRITGTSTVDYEGIPKTRFEVASPISPSDDPFAGFLHDSRFEPAAWLIGCPIPGGPWKQGEARGTRRYNLDDYRKDHPELVEREAREFGASTEEELLHHLRGDTLVSTADFPALSGAHPSPSGNSTETGVTVVRQPGGTVVVTIPTGTRARIEIEPQSANG